MLKGFDKLTNKESKGTKLNVSDTVQEFFCTLQVSLSVLVQISVSNIAKMREVSRGGHKIAK